MAHPGQAFGAYKGMWHAVAAGNKQPKLCCKSSDDWEAAV